MLRILNVIGPRVLRQRVPAGLPAGLGAFPPVRGAVRMEGGRPPQVPGWWRTSIVCLGILCGRMTNSIKIFNKSWKVPVGVAHEW